MPRSASASTVSALRASIALASVSRAASNTKTSDAYRVRRYSAMRSADADIASVSIHGDGRTGRYARGGLVHGDDARNAELARDDRAVRQHASALDHEAGDEEEHR